MILISLTILGADNDAVRLGALDRTRILCKYAYAAYFKFFRYYLYIYI